jgi:hypothetical protein
MSDETFPTSPAPDAPSSDILDEFNESAWAREDDALYRHLHEADMRDLLNGILERHDVWRRQAQTRGYPVPPSDAEEGDGE